MNQQNWYVLCIHLTGSVVAVLIEDLTNSLPVKHTHKASYVRIYNYVYTCVTFNLAVHMYN